MSAENQNGTNASPKGKGPASNSGAAPSTSGDGNSASGLKLGPLKNKDNNNSRRKKKNSNNNSGGHRVGTCDINSNSGSNSAPRRPPDYRMQEIVSLVNKFPVSQVNGKEFDPAHTRAISNFVKSSLSEKDIYLVLNVVPSDPEFPFDLDSLKVSLHVPINYPMKKNRENVPNNRPSVVVLNSEIPRGITFNIESGFKKIVKKSCEKKGGAGKTAAGKGKDSEKGKGAENEIKIYGGNNLVGIVRTLDHYLEYFLSQKKRDTVKFVRHAPTPKKPDEPSLDNVQSEAESSQASAIFSVQNTATGKDIKELNDSLDLISYKLNNKETDKRFTLFENYRGVGYVYSFRPVQDAFVQVNKALASHGNNFDIVTAISVLTSEFSFKNLSVKLFVPLDVKNNSIEITSFELQDQEFDYEDFNLQSPISINFLQEDRKLVLQQLLNNVKLNFNTNSKSLLGNANGSIFFLLNYLNSKFFELGFSGNVF